MLLLLACAYAHTFPSILLGHLAESVLPFSGLVHTSNDAADAEGYTNLEMFEYLAPDSEELA